jgi:hypothetical protein
MVSQEQATKLLQHSCQQRPSDGFGAVHALRAKADAPVVGLRCGIVFKVTPVRHEDCAPHVRASAGRCNSIRKPDCRGRCGSMAQRSMVGHTTRGPSFKFCRDPAIVGVRSEGFCPAGNDARHHRSAVWQRRCLASNETKPRRSRPTTGPDFNTGPPNLDGSF